MKNDYIPPKPKGFTFYYEIGDLLSELEDDQVGRVIKAIINFGLTSEVPELDKMEKMVFLSLKNYVDRSNEKYEEMCKRNKKIADEREKNK